MSDSQKFPFVRAMANMVNTIAQDNAAIRGQALPCHVVAVQGQIVTIQFEILPDGVQYPQITIPIATFAYIRYPIQVGDKGVTVPADVSLRGVSGLGAGMASPSLYPSLTPLFFVPIANSKWSDDEPDKLVLYGPDGAIMKTEKGDASVVVETGAVMAQAEKVTLKGMMFFDGPITQQKSGGGVDTTASMIGPVTIELDVTASGISLVNHTHDVEGVQSGGSTITTSKPK
ncbi:TPA: phage baseplate protein [Yersinia enterocolitica]